MSNWRYPSLSIHGIEGAFSGPGFKTVIPRKVIGKFSIRLVPNQDPLKIAEIVKAYIKSVWEKRQSPNKLKVIIFIKKYISSFKLFYFILNSIDYI